MRRRLFVIFVLIAFVALVVVRWSDVRQLLATVSRAQLRWLLVALALQVLYYYIYAALYNEAFCTVEVRSNTRQLVPVMLSSVFINAVAPSGGASAAALFINHAARRGQSPAAAAAGTVMVPAANLTTLNALLVAGLGYLIWQGKAQPFHTAAVAILFTANTIMVALLVLALRRPGFTLSLLTWAEVRANDIWQRLRHRPLVSSGWGATHSREFCGAASAIITHRGCLYRLLGLAMAENVVNLVTLYAVFVAYSYRMDLGSLTVGLAVGTVLGLIQVTPQGVGVVEGGMALTYSSLGVPAAASAAAVIVFRGLNVWLPTLVGFLLLQRQAWARRHH